MPKNIVSLFCLSSLLLLGFSCAKVTPKKNLRGKKSYTKGVEDEFSKIENDQRDVLEYYRRLRSQNWEAYKKKHKRKYSAPKKRTSSRPKVYLPKKFKANPKIVRPPTPKRKGLPSAQIAEMKIEIRQHMDYFCMEMRNSKRFSDTADCLAFTENIYNTCMAKSPVIYNRNPVKCIRGKLH